MSKNSLEVLFESKTRLKILKFLFRNLPKFYTAREVINHTQEHTTAVRREIERLSAIGLLQRQQRSYSMNPRFEFFSELRDLVLKSSPSEKRRLIAQIGRLGRIKLAVIAGIFLDKEIKDPLAVDLFLVGDDLDRRRLTNFLRNLESDIGKEVRFTTMEREEFKYRLGMFDRFIRVLLEGPHEKLINKLGI